MAKQGGKDMGNYLRRSSAYALCAIEEIRKLTGGLATDIIKDCGLDQAIGNNIGDTMDINAVKISFSKKGFKQGWGRR
jgi:hypothetical protein